MDITQRYRLIRNVDVGKPTSFLAEEVATGRQFFIHRLPWTDDATLCFYRGLTALDLEDLRRNANLLHVTEFNHTDSHLFVVLPYIPLTVRQILDQRRHFGEDTAGPFMVQLLSAVSYLRSKGLMHRHIQPSSLLLENDQLRRGYKLVLGGLQLLRPVQPYEQTMQEARYSPLRGCSRELCYRAPEILMGITPNMQPPQVVYSYAADIWACGCILAEMLTGRRLFPGDLQRTEDGQLWSIFRVLGSPCQADWPGVELLPRWSERFPHWSPQDLGVLVPLLPPLGVNLLKQMLTLDPNQRPTAEQCLDHLYIRGFVEEQ